MQTYLEFINEDVTNIKNPQFWEDVNLCFKEIIDLNGRITPFWDLCKKYPKILKKSEDHDTYDKVLVPLHNRGKIAKKISFYDTMYLWFHEIKKTNELLSKKNQEIKNNDFHNWFFNQEIDLYRGISNSMIFMKNGFVSGDRAKESLIEI